MSLSISVILARQLKSQIYCIANNQYVTISVQLMNAHQQEIENLIENMENDRTRQQDNLKRRLQERRRQRMDALQRKHGREEAREVLEQQKELKDVRANNVS
jgi:gas vesicle protein